MLALRHLRPSLRLLSSILLAATVAFGCGGGGGSEEPPITVYVRATGNDGNNGESPAQALASIQTALTRARAGDTIIVGPGTYLPPPQLPGVVVDVTAFAASESRPLVVLADPSGMQTGDPAGAVIIDAARGAFGVRVSGSAWIVIDGFTITNVQGNNAAGVQVRSGSNDITVRNCEIVGNDGDGVRIESSDRTLLFNNLIHDNAVRGIQISGGGLGAEDSELINNTVADNGNDGISVQGQTVRDTRVRNNLVVGHATRGIDVDGDATRGYEADYNLIFPTENAYGPLTPKGLHDQSVAPLFASGFRLAQERAGQQVTSPAVDAGDPGLDARLRARLQARTTATDDSLDTGIVDLGYHFPSLFTPPPTATPNPTETVATATPGVTPTAPPSERIYVRASGDDGNSGRSLAESVRTIGRALEDVAPGVQIIVGPGSYTENVILEESGTPDRPIWLRGDPTGAATNDPPGPVSIELNGSGQGVFVDGGRYWIVEGLTISGAGLGIHVRRDARGTIVRHNEIYGSVNEGILVQDTSDVTLFNNLIYCNGQSGIRITGSSTGSPNTRVINNTVVANGSRGVFVGTSGTPSENTFLRNNLLQNNCRNNLQVDGGSVDGYDARYNLVSPPTYFGVDPHPTDTAWDDGLMGAVDRPAKFVDQASCPAICGDPQPAIELHEDDFRLAQSIAGQEPPNSEGVDAGDPNLDAEFRLPLTMRTTASNDEPDGGRTDLGYHFPR